MKILAIETTAAACSAALVDETGTVERFEPMARGHAERLMPMIADVLEKAGAGYSALDLVAVATGPGTFTGLRVGLAAARGIALAAGRPCLGVTSFEAVLEAERPAAEAAWQRGETVLVVLDSRRSELFAQSFIAPAGAPMAAVVSRPEDLAALVAGPVGLIVGTAATAAGAAWSLDPRNPQPLVRQAGPRAAPVARNALRRWLAGERPLRAPDPIYLRAPETGGGTRAP